MRSLNGFVLGAVVALGASIAACGSSQPSSSATGDNGGGDNGGSGSGGSSGSGSGSSSGGAGDDASAANDAAPGVDSGSSGGVDSGPKDSGPPPWGGPSGPLTCSGNGSYKTNWSGTCGTDRWPVKTGTDSAASQIDMTPKLTTIADLVALSMPTTQSSTPRQPSEKTVWALKDVNLDFARLEDDSDYHLVLADGQGHTFIGEIPYPGCVSGGPLACNISRARATVDSQLTLVLDQGHSYSLAVSVIGVAFSDFEHGQYGAAPNDFEMHAVLAICFGVGCDPTKT